MPTTDQWLREISIRKRIEQHECTRGMVLRTRGKSVTLGREVSLPDGGTEFDPRIRLTAVGKHRFTIDVRRPNGRWDKTPFLGSLEEMFQVIETSMQHLVAEWPQP